MKINNIILFFLAIILSGALFSQDLKTRQKIDSLYNLAQLNVEDRDYESARANARRILKLQPDHYDSWILIARIYSWDMLHDSAKVEYIKLIDKEPGYWDAVDGLVDISVIKMQYDSALMYVNYGLDYHPKDKQFLYKKAEIYYKMGDYKKSEKVIEELKDADLDPSIRNANKLLEDIDSVRMYNIIRAEYNFEFYEQPWSRRWHIFSLSYQRRFKKATVIGRVSMADVIKSYVWDPIDKIAYPEDNFATNIDFQYEIEAYPIITKKSYLFIHAATSQKAILFARYRGGLEYFQGLPWGFEVSLGARYLYFDKGPQDEIWVYTGSLVKYFKKFWLSFRPYIVPKSNGTEQSYFLEGRRYFKRIDSYLFAEVGYGIAPDDPTRLITTSRAFDYKSYNGRLGIQYQISTRWLMWFQFGYGYEEYSKDKYRNAYKAGVKIGYYF